MGSDWPMAFMMGLYGLKPEDVGQRERELERLREEATAEDIEHSEAVVAAWNERALSRRRMSFYPTVKTALLAGTAVLEVLCPACQSIGGVDLRDIDIHPSASLSAVIRRLSCRRCCPNPPFAKAVGLKSGPPRWNDRRRG
jgi:hypothetical protein